MATYKVLQNIEAEDKLLGPLTLKQFIFAAIFVGLGFIGFSIATSAAPTPLKIPFILVLVPFMAIFGFLAAPIGRDQPNDLWLLARLNFLFKPRKRIWSQDGVKELVTVTAPKRVIHQYTDGLDQTEVRSRLQALANTMDSRGWAVKNVNTNLFAQPGYLSDDSRSDRLVGASVLPGQDIASDLQASDDILDVNSNQTAQHFDQLVKESSQSHRAQALETMKTNNPQQTPQDYWFMNQNQPPDSPPAGYSIFQSQAVVHPGQVAKKTEETDVEKEFAQRLVEDHKKTAEKTNERMKTIQPLHDREGNLVLPPPAANNDPVIPVPGSSNYQQPKEASSQQKGTNPAIINLAHNDDLNISTIARQANQKDSGDDEMVISLH